LLLTAHCSLLTDLVMSSLATANPLSRTAKALSQHGLELLRRVLPGSVKRGARRALNVMDLLKNRAHMTSGVQPLSQVWGLDRGLPIHRYYLGQFIEESISAIRGHCLEFQDDSYTRRYGRTAVTKSDILHLDHSRPRATIIADLTKPNDIPSGLFDCIICTHVLHVVFELDKIVAELHRILNAGGTLLVAVPHISMCGPRSHEIWRFTPEGLSAVLGKAFGADNVTVRSYGNSLTAAGELRGLVAHEFTENELNHHDPRFAVEVCARATKQI
jgi:SAM-dependent methyltransferase